MVRHEGACEECSRNCELLHSNKKDFSACVIRFFKIFIGKEISEAMILPPKFARTVKDLVDQEIKLEDSSGVHWNATLSYYEGKLAFHKGWKEFSCDHGLQVGEFLIFNYIKGSHFVVHIFDKAGVEKIGSNKNISVKRARSSGKTDSQDIPCQVTDTNAINFDKKCPPVKRARTRGNTDSQDIPCQVTDTNAMNSDKKCPPVKRARTSEKIASQGTPCRTTDTNIMNFNENGPSVGARTGGNMVAQDTPCWTNKARNEQSSSASVSSLSNLKNVKIQPMNTSETRNPEAGDVEQLCMDNACYLSIERIAGYAQTEDRTFLYDLSSFEKQENGCFADKNKKGTDVEEVTPNHVELIVRSQSEAADFVEDNAIGTAALKMPMATKVCDARMVENEKEFGPTDNMPPVHEKVHLDGLSTGLPFSTSSVKLADNCRKGDGLSNVAIPRQNAEQSNANSSNDGKSPIPDEDTSLNCGGEFSGPVFTGDAIKMMKQEKVEMKKQAYGHAQKPRKLEPSTPKESGSSSRAGRAEVEKIEPVNSLDALSTAASISCLAGTDGRDFIELAERLPSITFKKGRLQKKSLLLRDPVGRLWPALYNEQSGFFLLISGWKKINEANGVQPGDRYVFSVEDEIDSNFKMDIIRKQDGD